MNFDEILKFDFEHILHPYTSPTVPLPVIPVVSAKGVRLKLADGRELIDGMSSWWCAIHGYNNPILNAAINSQLSEMAHVMFGGITHLPAVRLAKKLIEITPDPIEKVFFCDSGSVAVEVAIKMALQYWFSRKKPEKNRLLTIKSGYHGDTFGAMAVCDPITGMHHLFKDNLVRHYFADAPRCRNDSEWQNSDIDSFFKIIKKNHSSIAAVILEPIVQGAGGMRFYAPQYLREVRNLCDKYNVLLIHDEIATGFGRTGQLFACHHADISPDIMCLGKAITGGYMSFAATLCSQEVCNTIGADNGVFMHGPTFMANPLACAVANASIDLLFDSNWQKKVSNIESGLINGLSPCKKLSYVKDVRVLGAIGVVELEKPVDMPKIQKAFVENGVWIRPFGRIVYLMPPFIINKHELDFLTDRLCKVVSEI